VASYKNKTLLGLKEMATPAKGVHVREGNVSEVSLEDTCPDDVLVDKPNSRHPCVSKYLCWAVSGGWDKTGDRIEQS
jgi:hypothetical protein